MEFSFVKSVLLLKANSENINCIFNASLMILLFMDFFIPMWQFYKNHVNRRGYVAPCERNGGMITRTVLYVKYSIYCPEEVMKSAKSSVCQLLWLEQTIFHLRVSLVILCCFIRCESIYPRCLQKLRKSIKNVTVSCLFITVWANLLNWQWLESFSKVVRTLCPTKRMTGWFFKSCI